MKSEVRAQTCPRSLPLRPSGYRLWRRRYRKEGGGVPVRVYGITCRVVPLMSSHLSWQTVGPPSPHEPLVSHSGVRGQVFTRGTSGRSSTSKGHTCASGTTQEGTPVGRRVDLVPPVRRPVTPSIPYPSTPSGVSSHGTVPGEDEALEGRHPRSVGLCDGTSVCLRLLEERVLTGEGTTDY